MICRFDTPDIPTRICNAQKVKSNRMNQRLELELDVVTDLSALELASRIAPLVQETIETMRQTLGAELDFDIFLVIDGREVRFVMEPV